MVVVGKLVWSEWSEQRMRMGWGGVGDVGVEEFG